MSPACYHDDTSDAACHAPASSSLHGSLDTEQTRTLQAWRRIQAEEKQLRADLANAQVLLHAATTARDEALAELEECAERCGIARRRFLATLGDE